MAERVEPGMTISCQEVVEIVTDYLEGLIDEAARVELEAHLALCEGCDEYLRQMRATISALGRVPLDSLSDEAKAALTSAFRGYPARDGSAT
jgi:anti-sigma factor RsiW